MVLTSALGAKHFTTNLSSSLAASLASEGSVNDLSATGRHEFFILRFVSPSRLVVCMYLSKEINQSINRSINHHHQRRLNCMHSRSPVLQQACVGVQYKCIYVAGCASPNKPFGNRERRRKTLKLDMPKTPNPFTLKRKLSALTRRKRLPVGYSDQVAHTQLSPRVVLPLFVDC